MSMHGKGLGLCAPLRHVSLVSLALLGACAAPSSGEDAPGAALEASCNPVVVDPARSLVVTDPQALALFPLERVMGQLVARAHADVPQTALGLYQQWFDTLNDPGHAQTDGPHCTGTINGFSAQCPRIEGILAATNPFPPAAAGVHDDTYHPTALSFRFDLAPSDGATCGEARIVYAKASAGPTDRNLVIFEGAIRNPAPAAGLRGCLPVAGFWALQSAVNDPSVRAKMLEGFYFDGAPALGLGPVIDPANFGMLDGRGQIRTNMFLLGRTYFAGGTQPATPQAWQLREFKTARVCAQPGGCRLEIHDVTTKGNPSSSLFADLPENAAFQNDFVGWVGPLASQSLTGIGVTVPEVYDTGESTAMSANDYAKSFDPNGAFAGRIAAQLAALGRTDLTPANVVDRMTTQSCAGCHHISNAKPLGGGLTWPSSEGFTMIDEQSNLATALTTVFLPYRKAQLEGFLNSACGSQGGNSQGEDGDQ